MSGALGSLPWSQQVQQASQAYGVPLPILQSVLQVESSNNPYPAVSSAGAIGPMQVMPTNAPAGVNLNDPSQNLAVGTSMLASLYKQFGNWSDALAAYNAGPNNLAAGQGYAQQVLALANGVNAPPGSATLPTVTVTAPAGSANAGADQPSALFYVLAIVLIAGLVLFGIWGTIKQS